MLEQRARHAPAGAVPPVHDGSRSVFARSSQNPSMPSAFIAASAGVVLASRSRAFCSRVLDTVIAGPDRPGDEPAADPRGEPADP